MPKPVLISPAELAARLALRPVPAITKEQLEDKIDDASFFVAPDGRTTFCQLELENGYTVFGQSTARDAENFDREIGEYFAYADAFRQLWPLFGFLKAEEGFEASLPAAPNPAMEALLFVEEWHKKHMDNFGVIANTKEGDEIELAPVTPGAEPVKISGDVAKGLRIGMRIVLEHAGKFPVEITAAAVPDDDAFDAE